VRGLDSSDPGADPSIGFSIGCIRVDHPTTLSHERRDSFDFISGRRCKVFREVQACRAMASVWMSLIQLQLHLHDNFSYSPRATSDMGWSMRASTWPLVLFAMPPVRIHRSCTWSLTSLDTDGFGRAGSVRAPAGTFQVKNKTEFIYPNPGGWIKLRTTHAKTLENPGPS
jgi:hypothetical protein